MEPLLSIKPKWIDLIASGSKTVELRKSFPEYSGRAWVYSCSPVKKIVGWMEIAHVEHDAPQRLWERLGALSCVPKEMFDCYYAGRSSGSGLVLGAWKWLSEPVSLERIGFKSPPQSWRWLDEKILKILLDA